MSGVLEECEGSKMRNTVQPMAFASVLYQPESDFSAAYQKRRSDWTTKPDPRDLRPCYTLSKLVESRKNLFRATALTRHGSRPPQSLPAYLSNFLDCTSKLAPTDDIDNNAIDKLMSEFGLNSHLHPPCMKVACFLSCSGYLQAQMCRANPGSDTATALVVPNDEFVALLAYAASYGYGRYHQAMGGYPSPRFYLL
ncbi:hypothetical protein DFP72DRAFT_853729 [Ephemerocybe angulata]|uniref:Uncharacterized protein n=1 Tax=Ephemerocybe angulata TaxID=980116 RepID=A0A8H6HKY1_9AGAR|nr:hypothetical protein DFP72DRAFT_853729 [Tulosesus angulatus]